MDAQVPAWALTVSALTAGAALLFAMGLWVRHGAGIALSSFAMLCG